MTKTDSLGKRLKYVREKKNIPQKELASLLGLQKSTISLYESDRVIPPSDKLSILADRIGVSTDYLLGKTDDSSPKITKNSPYSKENLLAQFGEEDQKLLLDYIEFLKNRKKD